MGPLLRTRRQSCGSTRSSIPVDHIRACDCLTEPFTVPLALVRLGTASKPILSGRRYQPFALNASATHKLFWKIRSPNAEHLTANRENQVASVDSGRAPLAESSPRGRKGCDFVKGEFFRTIKNSEGLLFRVSRRTYRIRAGDFLDSFALNARDRLRDFLGNVHRNWC